MKGFSRAPSTTSRPFGFLAASAGSCAFAKKLRRYKAVQEFLSIHFCQKCYKNGKRYFAETYVADRFLQILWVSVGVW
jgi:hypothetical protein